MCVKTMHAEANRDSEAADRFLVDLGEIESPSEHHLRCFIQP